MPLRTSSAPILQSLIRSASDPAGKDVHHFPDIPSPSTHSLFHHHQAPNSLSTQSSANSHYRGVDTLRSASSRDLLESDRASRLHRAESDGSLAFFNLDVLEDDEDNQSAMASWSGFSSSSSSKHWTKRASPNSKQYNNNKRQSSDSRDSTMENGHGYGLHSPTNRSLDDILSIKNFSLNDGEVYNSIRLSPSGSLLACNGKGCRPLTDSECNKLGIYEKPRVESGNFCLGDYGNGHAAAAAPPSEEMAPSSGTDSYYEELLKSDPQNPLLLSNYAQFLYERGDIERSEEYYGRAILADPKDGEVLSQYAKLQWDVHRDQDRAESYFQQSAQAAPDDCYVMASYASFLWDVEGEEDHEEVGDGQIESSQMPNYGAAQSVSPPVIASV